MNKKGFTTVELILTLAIVMVVMATILSVTYNYRDKGSYERVLTDMNTYKNTITKIIYDDIFDIRESGESKGKVIKIEKVNASDNTKYNLVTSNNTKFLLQIIDRNVAKNGKSIREVGINYDGTDYIIPGSDNSYIEFKNVEFQSNNGNIYALNITFYNNKVSKDIKLHFLVVV